MKPIAPEIRQDGKPDPKWLILVYAIGTVSLIVMWAYIMSNK